MSKLGLLPLFPDLLEQCDPLDRSIDYLRRGHAVWCIDDLPSRSVTEDLSEQVALAIVYDDERFSFERDRTGKCWIVEIKHHFYEYVMVETGWGKSRRSERKLRYRARIHEKRFPTRESAIEFAELIQSIFERIKRAREAGE